MNSKEQYRVTERVSIRREGDVIFLVEHRGNHTDILVSLKLNEAWAVGSHLRDMTNDHLVEGGWIGMEPSPHWLDKLDYERDS